MTSSGLYGQMYGMPIVRMSVWPSHLDELLLVDVLEGDLVHGLDLAGLHAGHLVRAPRCRGRSCGAPCVGVRVQALGRAEVGGAVAARSTPTRAC